MISWNLKKLYAIRIYLLTSLCCSTGRRLPRRTTLPPGDDTESRMVRRRLLDRRLWVALESPPRKDSD
jgi:hypothetical protein